VNKLAKTALWLLVIACVFVPTLALAQGDGEASEEETAVVESNTLHLELGAIGAALVILGGAWGISKIGANAVESMARQPEVAGNIQTAMLISGALIEGITFLALIICLLALYA
jgi:F-type H+-transporting ATPase subunit c